MVGRRAEGRNRGERGRTASQTGQWLWQERVRAEKNQGERAPRCAEQAGWRRFLATEARNAKSRIAFGVSDICALERRPGLGRERLAANGCEGSSIEVNEENWLNCLGSVLAPERARAARVARDSYWKANRLGTRG